MSNVSVSASNHRLIQVPYNLCFETFANELRVEIIQALMKKSLTVNELSKELNVEQSRLSHSLQMLRTCSYVDVEQKGKEHVYSLVAQVKEGLQFPSEKANIFQIIHRHAHTMCASGCKKV
ncbi:MAG: winged helix-turn-helix domain-containing protein [Candidatus Diapherotrites archaeon]|nr:winged helix-turn-helix domain-containing protein [Candidatus Diapherotrites archaeon]